MPRSNPPPTPSRAPVPSSAATSPPTDTPLHAPAHARSTAQTRVPAAQRSRIACLLVPDLPLCAVLRAEPELVGRALVVTTGPGSRAEILCASRTARRGGVEPGQSLTQARAVLPGLEVRVASPVLERTARAALLDVALSLSPRAEAVARGSALFAAEGAVLVDASGITALHANENHFTSLLHARAERAGLAGFVALASSRTVSHLAARQLALAARFAPAARTGPTTRVLSPGREEAFLAPLPIDLLDPDDETADALSRFGLRTLRDLLGLSRRDLAARVGPAILSLIATARGEEIATPLSAPAVRELEEGIELEWAVDSQEPLAFVLRGLASRLCARLALRALGCGALHVRLRFERGGEDVRLLALASPTQDERVLLRLARQALESRPPAAAIDGVVLACEGVPLRREQLDLFRARGPDPNQLDQTLAELGALCGPARVGSPTVVDDHRPDAFALRPFTGRVAEPRTSVLPGPRLGLRAIRPPAPAEVRVAGGRPVFVRSAVARGEVVELAGPWRTTGHWWSETGHFAVDHYDVQTSDGNVVRLCFDWRKNGWQVDGLYD